MNAPHHARLRVEAPLLSHYLQLPEPPAGLHDPAWAAAGALASELLRAMQERARKSGTVLAATAAVQAP